MTVFLFIAVPLLVVWLAIGIAEVVIPAKVLRWRRVILDRQNGKLGSAQVAEVFDRLTGEANASEPWTDKKVLSHVRVFGVVNLALVIVAGFAVVQVARH